MDTQYLEQYADENFSGFEGDSDVSLYTGEGDDFLDFEGPTNSFANQNDLSRTFSVSINNAGTTAKKMVIFNGYKKEKVLSDEILMNETGGGVAIDPYTVTSNPSSLDELREFLNSNPATLGFIRLNSTNPQQLEQPISLSELTPFRSPQVNDIFLQKFVGENTFRDNIVTVPTPGLIVGSETKLAMTILPGSSITVTFFFGAVLSNASALKSKYRKAASSIAVVGLPNVLKSQSIRRGLNK